MMGSAGMAIWGSIHDIETPSVLLPYIILFSWGCQLVMAIFIMSLFIIAIIIQHIVDSQWIKRYLTRKNPKNSTKSFSETIVGSYLKSLYTKACPRITWIDDSETKANE